MSSEEGLRLRKPKVNEAKVSLETAGSPHSPLSPTTPLEKPMVVHHPYKSFVSIFLSWCHFLLRGSVSIFVATFSYFGVWWHFYKQRKRQLDRGRWDSDDSGGSSDNDNASEDNNSETMSNGGGSLHGEDLFLMGDEADVEISQAEGTMGDVYWGNGATTSSEEGVGKSMGPTHHAHNHNSRRGSMTNTNSNKGLTKSLLKKVQTAPSLLVDFATDPMATIAGTTASTRRFNQQHKDPNTSVGAAAAARAARDKEIKAREDAFTAASVLRQKINERIRVEAVNTIEERDLRLSIATWNVDQQPPPEDPNELADWLLGKCEDDESESNPTITPQESPTDNTDANISITPLSQSTIEKGKDNQAKRPKALIDAMKTTKTQKLRPLPDIVVVGFQEVELGGAALVLETTESKVAWTEAVLECLNNQAMAHYKAACAKINGPNASPISPTTSNCPRLPNPNSPSTSRKALSAAGGSVDGLFDLGDSLEPEVFGGPLSSKNESETVASVLPATTSGSETPLPIRTPQADDVLQGTDKGSSSPACSPGSESPTPTNGSSPPQRQISDASVGQYKSLLLPPLARKGAGESKLSNVVQTPRILRTPSSAFPGEKGLRNSNQSITSQKDSSNHPTYYRYKKVESLQLVGLVLLVIARNDHLPHIYHVRTSLSRTGVRGIMGNKGAIGARFSLYGKRFLFLAAHFDASVRSKEKRNANYTDAMTAMKFPSLPDQDDELDRLLHFAETVANGRKKGESGRSAYDRFFFKKMAAKKDTLASAGKEARNLTSHDYVFFFGDLNYRLNVAKEQKNNKNKIIESASILQRLTGKVGGGQKKSSDLVSPMHSEFNLRSKKHLKETKGDGIIKFITSKFLGKSSKGAASPASPLSGDAILSSPTLQSLPAPLSPHLFAQTQSSSAALMPLINVREFVAAGRLKDLLAVDQLRREMERGRIFKGFHEQEITFPPTYKFDRGTRTYDTSRKKRDPAWCDRVLYWFAPQGQYSGIGGAKMAKVPVQPPPPIVAQAASPLTVVGEGSISKAPPPSTHGEEMTPKTALATAPVPTIPAPNMDPTTIASDPPEVTNPQANHHNNFHPNSRRRLATRRFHFTRNNVVEEGYDAFTDIIVSDHRPVSARFTVTVGRAREAQLKQLLFDLRQDLGLLDEECDEEAFA